MVSISENLRHLGQPSDEVDRVVLLIDQETVRGVDFGEEYVLIFNLPGVNVPPDFCLLEDGLCITVLVLSLKEAHWHSSF